MLAPWELGTDLSLPGPVHLIHKTPDPAGPGVSAGLHAPLPTVEWSQVAFPVLWPLTLGDSLIPSRDP